MSVIVIDAEALAARIAGLLIGYPRHRSSTARDAAERLVASLSPSTPCGWTHVPRADAGGFNVTRVLYPTPERVREEGLIPEPLYRLPQ